MMRDTTPPPQGEDAAVLTPSRILRLAFSRAADRIIGMPLVVLGVNEDVVTLDQMIALLDEDMMLLPMFGLSGPVGMCAVNLQMRAAVIEMQTRGSVAARMAAPRKVTATDIALSVPMLSGFVQGLADTGGATYLCPWVGGARLDSDQPTHFADARAASLALPDELYRLVRLSVDLGAGERQGEVLLALPDIRPAKPSVDAPGPGVWAAALRGAVMAAPARIDAVLYRKTMTLHAVETLQVGQVIGLSGGSVCRVEMIGVDGGVIARGRLGQMAGQRAVRIEAPRLPEMEDDTPLRRAALPPAMGRRATDPKMDVEGMHEVPQPPGSGLAAAD